MRQPPDQRFAPADRHPGERGAALLTVLLLVAVIAVLAATALERVRLATRLAGNGVAIEQSRGYALAAETMATTRIDSLLSTARERVTLAGGWSGKPFQLPVPGGLATATVVDGGNCFNLNGLVIDTDGVLTARTTAITQFARLMQLVGIPQQAGASIAAATTDWIDSDTVALPNGAEDSDYRGGTNPYRTPNAMIADISELRAVKGMTPAFYAKIRPWVCAQPRAEPSKMNINTLLPEQAALIAMLLPYTLSVDRARTLLLQRPPQGFASAYEFWKLPAQSGITPDPAAAAQIAVTTRWFELKVEVELGGTELIQNGLIDARQAPARLVSRSWGDPA